MAPSVVPTLQAGSSRSFLAVAGRIVGKRRTTFAAVAVDAIDRNPRQPRQVFEPGALDELAQSIRARGVLQPVIVQPARDGRFTLVAGERRFRAAQLAGLDAIPAVFCEGDLLEVALEENLQREDLSPLEEAAGLAALAEDRGLTHAQLAELVHKSRPYVSNTLALNRLPVPLRAEILASGSEVSRELLIAIARQDEEPAMRRLWRRVQLEQLSVRAYRRSEEPLASADRDAPSRVEAAARRLRKSLNAASGELAALPLDEKVHLAAALRRTARLIEKTIAHMGIPCSGVEDPARRGRRSEGHRRVA